MSLRAKPSTSSARWSANLTVQFCSSPAARTPWSCSTLRSKRSHHRRFLFQCYVDTGHNFPEVITYRDETVDRLGVRLVVAHVQDWIDDGRLRERSDGTRNPLKRSRCLNRSCRTSSTLSLVAAAATREGSCEGTRIQPSRRVWPMGPAPSAARTVGRLQRSSPARRARPSVPSVELDRS